MVEPGNEWCTFCKVVPKKRTDDPHVFPRISKQNIQAKHPHAGSFGIRMAALMAMKSQFHK